MALLHLDFKYGRSWCGRQLKTHALSEVHFIELYQERNGKEMCSKCAKSLIEKGKLVASENTITESMQLLIDKLTISSKSLHDEYIERVRVFSNADFDRKQQKVKRPISEWEKEYGVVKEVSRYSRDGSLSYKYDRLYYKMVDAQDRLNKIIAKGKSAFVAKDIADAERHYKDAILKLAERIQQQSLNVSKMKITYGKVGENGIDTVITDGVNSVHAWTIIAALDSQLMRPHYRYLVK